MRRAGPLLLALLLVAGLAISPACASGEPGHAHHESSAAPLAILLLALTALGVAAAGRQRRATSIVTLGLLFGVFGVETAVHSVHHGADPQGAASCAFFAASQHDDITGAADAITAIPTWTTEPSPLHGVFPPRSRQAFRSHEGRAPPASLSA